MDVENQGHKNNLLCEMAIKCGLDGKKSVKLIIYINFRKLRQLLKMTIHCLLLTC